MNKKQKNILISFTSISLVLFIVWIAYGREIFTRFQVLVEKKDELFGWSEKQWVDKFVLGLDWTAGIILILAVISAVLFYIYRTPKTKNELS